MVLHIHQEKTDALDLNSIAKEFAHKCEADCSLRTFFILTFLDHIKLLTCNNESIKIKSVSVYCPNISVAVT